ncbi:MAG: DinB family protein [Chloroflexi bacterium]|nr:DinB family protein [Chloroflexota bacterium]MDA1145087.1 DinB family protein [Chloroflexota bacterium]
MPQYVSARYSEQPRYLRKTLREVAHRIEELAVELTEDEAREHIPEDDWSVVELAGFLRDSEREDLRAINSMVMRDGARIDERRAQYGPAENNYQAKHLDELIWYFATIREETLWTLNDIDGLWHRTGTHPYRGTVTLTEWVREMNERDLDVMWRIGRIVERLRAHRR